VKKIVVPPGDPGRFSLQIDGAAVVSGVGNGGSSNPVTVVAGTHSVAESAAPGTDLTDYIVSLGGDCDASGRVILASGDNKVCTITNRKRTDSCSIACNKDELQCMLKAHDFTDRRECVTEKLQCLQGCAN
jgi:hypothetical protein